MRALLLSDIHGNLEALEAVLAAAPAHDQIWNLGDVVGYGASPNEVIDIIRLLGDAHVRGNHDKVASGLLPPTNFNPNAREAAEWTSANLTNSSRQWLLDLPPGPLTPANSSSCISHGSPTGEDRYILSIRDAWEPLQRANQQTTCFGHTHLQGGFQLLEKEWLQIRPEHIARSSQWTIPLENNGTRYLINPGSVGQPRDGDWRAAFALLNENEEVTFFREPYDLARAQGRMLLAGLPERLAQRLREGR